MVDMVNYTTETETGRETARDGARGWPSEREVELFLFAKDLLREYLREEQFLWHYYHDRGVQLGLIDGPEEVGALRDEERRELDRIKTMGLEHML